MSSKPKWSNPHPSNHIRRGKPRLSYQTESSLAQPKLNRNLPRHKRSKIGRITPFPENNKGTIENNAENVNAEAQEVQNRMYKQMDVSPENPISAPLVRSSFSTRYPAQRESYIRVVAEKIEQFFKKYGIEFNVDYAQCIMSVHTTKKMWDPYSIIKARDMIRLISRYVPFEHASKVMNDDTFSEIIEIGKTDVARNQVRFIKRRARLIGPNGVTLKAIELLTKCYVLVYGRSACAIGPFKGTHMVKRIVKDCMRNIHPIYQLKRLMVEQELASNVQLANESWDRFLPTFKRMKRNKTGAMGGSKVGKRGLTVNQIKKMANKKKNKKSKYTPWPPAPTPSKVDIAMETGAYWNKKWRKENLKRLTAEEKKQKHEDYIKKAKMEKREKYKVKKKTQNRIEHDKIFIPPPEVKYGHVKRKGAFSNVNASQFTKNIKKRIEKKKQDSNLKRYLL